MGTRGLGAGSLPAGYRGRAPVVIWGKAPEARYAYTISSGQTHFRDVFIEDIRCTFKLMWSLLPPPYYSKKLFEVVSKLMVQEHAGSRPVAIFRTLIGSHGICS